jgi:hypothetical protein
MRITLSVALTSNDHVPALEVIHNGKVIKTIDCSPEIDQQKTVELVFEEPDWFLVRGIVDVDHTFRFASTAPWYLERPGEPNRVSRAAATFFLDWEKQRIGRVKNNAENEDDLAAVLDWHEQALRFWSQRVREVNAP